MTNATGPVKGCRPVYPDADVCAKDLDKMTDDWQPLGFISAAFQGLPDGKISFALLQPRRLQRGREHHGTHGATRLGQGVDVEGIRQVMRHDQLEDQGGQIRPCGYCPWGKATGGSRRRGQGQRSSQRNSIDNAGSEHCHAHPLRCLPLFVIKLHITLRRSDEIGCIRGGKKVNSIGYRFDAELFYSLID